MASRGFFLWGLPCAEIFGFHPFPHFKSGSLSFETRHARVVGAGFRPRRTKVGDGPHGGRLDRLPRLRALARDRQTRTAPASGHWLGTVRGCRNLADMDGRSLSEVFQSTKP